MTAQQQIGAKYWRDLDERIPRAEVEEMMIVIAKDKVDAAATQETVEKEEAIATSKAAECAEIKESAERDLAEALPALDAAVAVLRRILRRVEEYRTHDGAVAAEREELARCEWTRTA